MAKQWTRNYDNLFSAVFGCYFIDYAGATSPTFETPTVRYTNGNYYPIPLEGDAYRFSASYGVTMPPPRIYGETANLGSFSSNNWMSAPVCIALGTGTTPPTYEDYKLEAPITSNMTLNSVSTSQTYDPDTHIYTKTYKIPIAYSGVEDVTINEFGIYVGTNGGSSTSYPYIVPSLMYRETLDTPVTLSQNDTIEITFSQSIAQPNYTPYPTE